MLERLLGLVCLFCMMNTTLHAGSSELPDREPAPGISQALARWRAAHYADVRYALRIEVTPTFDRLSGRLTLRWRLSHPLDLILDWRPPTHTGEARVASLRVNGQSASVQTIHDHLVVPAALLHEGENVLELHFDSPVAAARTAVTRYVDREDGGLYLYSLFVPADASTVFPCIDQPDVKARFELELVVPNGNQAVANAPLLGRSVESGLERFRFAATPPISTYVFAFAVGPFIEFTDQIGGHRLFVRASQEARVRTELSEVMRLNREGVRYFEQLFARPFPFPKYDLVLLPEFPYGGMEHAGATFLREDAVLFTSQPTAADLLRRAQLIFHEASHQWFGDLVTMRWFDDLWLKEGFANLMAMRAADALLPDIDARNALRALKVSAYRTDVTAGTTPIWQALPNLSAAKSAYGSIVYSKAPAVLHQVSHFVGRDAFIAGVRAFLGRHAFANATWEELVVELEQASGMDLGQWAQAWVHRAGLPRVDIDWQVDEHGRIAALSLRQRALPERMHSEQVSWPQRVELLLVPMQGPGRTFDVTMNASVTPIEAAVGLPAPKMAFANAGDWGYGVFMLNEVSMNETVAHLGEIEDGLLRALLWDALWEAVRAQRLHPREWVELALRELPHERDEVTVAGLLGNLQTALRWYLDDEQRNVMQTRAETLLERGMFSAATAGLRIACFRSYVSLAASGPAREMLKALLEGSVSVEGLVLRSVDRFRIVRTLLALGDPQAETLLERQREQDGSDDGRRHAYATEAARADIPTKLRYFDAFLNDDDLPERWIEDALTGFNTVEQEDLTLPLLERALKALPRLKRERRIFFVNNWLAAFLGGQRSAHAVDIVERFLADDALDADLRRKVLEAEDALMRTAAIRAR